MANICHIETDASGQNITIKVVDDATGILAAGYNSIVLSLSDLKNADGITRRAFFQWFYWRDSATCDYFRSKILMTAPEADPTQGGTITTP